MAEESGVVSRQKNTVASTRIGGYECISLRGVTHDTRSHQAERGLKATPFSIVRCFNDNLEPPEPGRVAGRHGRCSQDYLC